MNILRPRAKWSSYGCSMFLPCPGTCGFDLRSDHCRLFAWNLMCLSTVLRWTCATFSFPGWKMLRAGWINLNCSRCPPAKKKKTVQDVVSLISDYCAHRHSDHPMPTACSYATSPTPRRPRETAARERERVRVREGDDMWSTAFCLLFFARFYFYFFNRTPLYLRTQFMFLFTEPPYRHIYK